MANLIFQALMVGLQGPQPSAEEELLLSRFCPGGVVLFGRNIEGVGQTAELCARLFSICEVPPIIAVDQEGGPVNRLRGITSASLSPQELAAGAGLGAIRRFGRITGGMLAALGINMNLAPVVDLRKVEADNSLPQRHWGSDVAEVTARAAAFIEGLDEAGVQGCLKHFPGLGRAAVDPHQSLPTVEEPYTVLRDEDLAPFVTLADRVPAVMMSHCRYTGIDGESAFPASLSPALYLILRSEACFDGMALTDDLEMGALAGDCPTFIDRFAMALGAGADVLVVSNQMLGAEEPFDLLRRIAGDGLVPEERLREAAERVLAVKEFFPRSYRPDRNLRTRFGELDSRLAALRDEVLAGGR